MGLDISLVLAAVLLAGLPERNAGRLMDSELLRLSFGSSFLVKISANDLLIPVGLLADQFGSAFSTVGDSTALCFSSLAIAGSFLGSSFGSSFARRSPSFVFVRTSGRLVVRLTGENRSNLLPSPISSSASFNMLVSLSQGGASSFSINGYSLRRSRGL
jgi:hypothetical protein